MREGMNHLLRTQDFTELEAALRAADGHLELNAPEEGFGELRRAQVQVETLAWLSIEFFEDDCFELNRLCTIKSQAFSVKFTKKVWLLRYFSLSLAVAHQFFQLREKALDIGKLLVDRSKADIGHFIDLFQLLHGQFTNAHTGHLAVIGAHQALLNAADSPFQCIVTTGRLAQARNIALSSF